VIVLDTHAWVWWAGEDKRLSSPARTVINEADSIGVCAISCWEVVLLVRKGRLALSYDVRTRIRSALALERVEALPLTTDIALEAALIGVEKLAGDAADRMIYATARSLAAPLVTKDQRIRRFDPALTVW
jgi:PIN domain nuclease of toxin-antitoxin system